MTSIAEQVGRVVGGRYRLLAPVGTGASSQVYAASDTRLARRVAIKVLHPMLASDRAFLRRFRAEARLAASLDHPHIMRVFDWGEENEGPYLVLEYLGGGSLRALLDTGARLSHSQAALVGAQAASGLAYAHRRGIVHRDIKPSNLLFDDEGHLRIADFGVARALAESALTEPLGAIFGTARYASPEQAESRPLDDRTDVYSLALVLYETLTGRVPFSGDTITAMLMARVGATLPSATELGPLAPILAQAAISEPLARLDTAALYSDLELLGRELPPADHLPLARTSAAPGTVRWSDRDPTIVDGLTLERLAAAEADAGLGDVVATDVAGAPAASSEVASAVGDLTFLGLAAETGSGLLGVTPLPTTGPDDPTAPHPAPGYEVPESTVVLAPAAGAFVAGPAAAETGRRRRRRPRADARPPRRLRWVKWAVAVVILLGAAVGASLYGVHYAMYDHVVPTLQSLPLNTAEQAAARVGLSAKETSARYDAAVPAGEVIGQSIPPGRHERAHTVVGLVVSLGVAPVPVPSLTGDPWPTAVHALTAGHLRHHLAYEYNATVGNGDVISWSHKGARVPPNTVIDLTVSKGPAPRPVPSVPRVDTFAQAQLLLSHDGFKAVETKAYSVVVPIHEVISTTPNPSSGPQSFGTTVSVSISLGPHYVFLPPLVGDSVFHARQLLMGLGFKVIVRSRGTVIYSLPGSDTRQLYGSKVYLFGI